MSDTVFQTSRLRVRRWRESDLAQLVAVYGDADAMTWVGDGKPLTRDQCLLWLERTRANYEKFGYGMFAVERKPDNEAIGFCGLIHPGGQTEPEAKYAYDRACWGQGIATEALIGLLRYAVETHQHDYIIATAPENIPSHRVLLKAGMTRGQPIKGTDGSTTELFEYFAGGNAMQTDLDKL